MLSVTLFISEEGIVAVDLWDGSSGYLRPGSMRRSARSAANTMPTPRATRHMSRSSMSLHHLGAGNRHSRRQSDPPSFTSASFKIQVGAPAPQKPLPVVTDLYPTSSAPHHLVLGSPCLSRHHLARFASPLSLSPGRSMAMPPHCRRDTTSASSAPLT